MRPISSNRRARGRIASYVWLAAPAERSPHAMRALSSNPRVKRHALRGGFHNVVLTIDGHTDYILDCAQLGGQARRWERP